MVRFRGADPRCPRRWSHRPNAQYRYPVGRLWRTRRLPMYRKRPKTPPFGSTTPRLVAFGVPNAPDQHLTPPFAALRLSFRRYRLSFRSLDCTTVYTTVL